MLYRVFEYSLCFIVLFFSNTYRKWKWNYKTESRLRWSRGCVLASRTQVREFKPGRSRRIFEGEKIPSTPSFGGEVKPAAPCCRFKACKRSLNVTWKSAFRQNSRLLFVAHSPLGSLASRRTWRHDGDSGNF
jgi:hypothetical protein